MRPEISLRFYNKFQPYIKRTAYLISFGFGHWHLLDKDDLFQEGCLALISSLENVDWSSFEIPEIIHYLKLRIRGGMVDAVRRFSTTATDVGCKIVEESVSPLEYRLEFCGDSWDRIWFFDIMNFLPKRLEREIIIGKFVWGFTFEELKVVLGHRFKSGRVTSARIGQLYKDALSKVREKFCIEEKPWKD